MNQSSDCGCLEVANPGSRFEKVFTYDDAGNITGISWTNIPSYNQTYAYDEVNRLTSAATYRGAFRYTYDKVGNRLTASQEGTPETQVKSCNSTAAEPEIAKIQAVFTNWPEIRLICNYLE